MSNITVPQLIQQENINLRSVHCNNVKMTDDEIEKLDRVFIGVLWTRRAKKTSGSVSIGEDSTFELHFMQPEAPGYLELFEFLRSANMIRVAFLDDTNTKDVMTVTFDYCSFIQESVVAKVVNNTPMSRVFLFSAADIIDKQV